MACRILVPQPRDQAQVPGVKVQSPNHWIPREFPSNSSDLNRSRKFPLHQIQGVSGAGASKMPYGSWDPGASSPCPALRGLCRVTRIHRDAPPPVSSLKKAKEELRAHGLILEVKPHSPVLAFGHTRLQWRLAGTVFHLNTLCSAKNRGFRRTDVGTTDGLSHGIHGGGGSHGGGRDRNPQIYTSLIYSRLFCWYWTYHFNVFRLINGHIISEKTSYTIPHDYLNIKNCLSIFPTL